MSSTPGEDNSPNTGLEPAAAQGQHQCSVCSKRYKRREHLVRHINSHKPERPYSCTSCDSSFRRADVLKRHLVTCDGATDAASKITSKRRSCDRCIRQKKACSLGQPCQNCSKRAFECYYSGGQNSSGEQYDFDTIQPFDVGQGLTKLNGDPASLVTSMGMPFGLLGRHFESMISSSEDTLFDPNLAEFFTSNWEDVMAATSYNNTSEELPIQNTQDYLSLEFLDSMTRDTGFHRSFDCGTVTQRQQVLSALQVEAASESESQHGTLFDSIVEPNQPEDIESLQLNWLSDPLSLKTHQILFSVKEVVQVKPRNSTVTLEWSTAVESECLKFFSPINLRKFLGLYWAIWHPNVNFVHRPTFDPISAQPTILATMTLIGASVSPDISDNENARMWYNCIEEIVFRDEDFNSDFPCDPRGGLAALQRKVQALQAAYMVCLYQNWEGTDASKSRVRRSRFATLISAARDVGLTTGIHRNYSAQARHEFEWNYFATREEIIRVFTWIFLLDTAFVIFNNLPPRMVAREMKMHLAMPEACFQAPTAEQCYEQILLFLPENSPYWKLSFRGAVESLCKNNFSTHSCQSLAALGPLNLFALTSAIHPLIFQYRNSFGSAEMLSPVRNALANWKEVWQTFVSTCAPGVSPHVTVGGSELQTENMWKRVGFCRFCPEYWLLANFIVDRLITLQKSRPENWEIGQDELEPFNNAALEDPLLDKYDQTSLRQINNLILDFQKVQI